jgi:hypothetical protein
MIVAVDARELAGRPTGVGRYLAELLDQWADSADARRHQWHFYAHQQTTVPSALSPAAVVIPGLAGRPGNRSPWHAPSRARGRMCSSRPDTPRR